MLIIKKLDYRHDTKFLYALRKNIQVRNFFFDNKITNYLNHLFWIREVVNKKLTFIVYFQKKKIGYIRYVENRKFYTISIASLPNFRKKGLMKKAFFKTEKILKKKFIFAEVAAYNKASKKFFKSCGFKITQILSDKIILKKLLRNN